jgi:hypothetical protein
VAKDRAAPFSKKHRRYWLPVIGMMVVIGAINLGIGWCAYPGDDALYRAPDHIIPVLPNLHPDGGGPNLHPDGGGPTPDAAPTPAPAPAAPDASP